MPKQPLSPQSRRLLSHRLSTQGNQFNAKPKVRIQSHQPVSYVWDQSNQGLESERADVSYRWPHRQQLSSGLLGCSEY